MKGQLLRMDNVSIQLHECMCEAGWALHSVRYASCTRCVFSNSAIMSARGDFWTDERICTTLREASHGVAC